VTHARSGDAAKDFAPHAKARIRGREQPEDLWLLPARAAAVGAA
jgi:hypothetical protein